MTTESGQEKPGCLFCGLSKEKDFKIEYEDTTLVAFQDIRPGAECHLLITPRQHIDNATKLTKDDLDLVRAMQDRGKALLTDKGFPPNRQKLGFHLPPLILVSHLHLHVFGLPHTTMFAKIFFAESGLLGARWFITVERLIRLLEEGQTIGLRSAML